MGMADGYMMLLSYSCATWSLGGTTLFGALHPAKLMSEMMAQDAMH